MSFDPIADTETHIASIEKEVSESNSPSLKAALASAKKRLRVLHERRIVELETKLTAAEKRVAELEAALKFYAGRKRADGNGYEFDKEPSGFLGEIARQALAGRVEG